MRKGVVTLVDEDRVCPSSYLGLTSGPAPSCLVPRTWIHLPVGVGRTACLGRSLIPGTPVQSTDLRIYFPHLHISRCG